MNACKTTIQNEELFYDSAFGKSSLKNSRKLRMRRLFEQHSGKTIILPLDHGVTIGPAEGIENISILLRKIHGSKINCVILHKGQIAKCHNIFFEDARVAVILHLSASVCLSPHASEKVLVASVEEAVKIGADAVSVHVNLGAEADTKMISDLGRVSETAHSWNMPLIAMMYCQGKGMDAYHWRNNAIAARVAMEAGADIVKLNYTGSPETLKRVISGAGIPVVISGGPKADSLQLIFSNIYGAMQAGAAGVAIGRNLFQFEQPALFAQALDLLVHKNATVKDALAYVQERINESKSKGVLNVEEKGIVVHPQ